MALYRKKPVVIEAEQFTAEASADRIREWANSYAPLTRRGENVTFDAIDGKVEELFVYTLEGVMRADPGDWIIRGVKGEFYPCKPDVFEATYDPADVA